MAKKAKDQNDNSANEEKKQELIVLPSKALTPEFGSKVGEAIIHVFAAGDQITQLQGDQRGYRREALAQATLGVLNLIKNDPDFDATAAFSTEANWRKQVARIYVAFGFRDKEGNLTEMGKKLFPAPGEDPKTDANAKRKSQIRNNVATALKKATQQALAIHQEGMTAKLDPAAHSLRLIGAPAAIAGKGQTEVVLDGEKRAGAAYSASFESLRDIAMKKNDPEKYAAKSQKAQGGTADADSLSTSAITSEETAAKLVATLVTYLNKASDTGVSKDQYKRLENLHGQLGSFLKTVKVTG